MSEGQFYETKDDRGKRLMLNVNNIAFMSADVHGTRVILNVKDKDGHYVEFISKDDFERMSENVKHLDKFQFSESD